MSKKPKLIIDNLMDGKARRHYVAATVTQEGEWNQHEPNNGLARMFVIMLLLHVFIIGGIILYDFIGEEQADPQAPAARAMAAKPKPTTAPSATATKPAIEPGSATLESYEVRSGDSLPLIIARLGVDKDEFIQLNQLEQEGQISPGAILRVPARKVAAPQQVAAAQPTPAINATPPSSAPTGSQTSVADHPPEPTVSSSTDNGAIVAVTLSPTSTLVSLSAENEPAPATTLAASPPTSSSSSSKEEQPKAKPAPKAPAASAPPKPVPPPSEMAKRPIAKADEPPKPAAKKTAVADAPPKTATKSASTTHTLAKGETLYRLSSKYGIPVDALIKANNIKDPAKLRDGTKLIIPAR